MLVQIASFSPSHFLQMPSQLQASRAMPDRSTPFITVKLSALLPCPTLPSLFTLEAKVVSRSGTSHNRATNHPFLSLTVFRETTISAQLSCCLMEEPLWLEVKQAHSLSGIWPPQLLGSKLNLHLEPQLAMLLPSARIQRSALAVAVTATLQSGIFTIRPLCVSSKATQMAPAALTFLLMVQSCGLVVLITQSDHGISGREGSSISMTSSLKSSVWATAQQVTGWQLEWRVQMLRCSALLNRTSTSCTFTRVVSCLSDLLTVASGLLLLAKTTSWMLGALHMEHLSLFRRRRAQFWAATSHLTTSTLSLALETRRLRSTKWSIKKTLTAAMQRKVELLKIKQSRVRNFPEWRYFLLCLNCGYNKNCANCVALETFKGIVSRSFICITITNYLTESSTAAA